MVDIQSVTAEIRRGKKEERKKGEQTTGQKYNGLPYSIRGHEQLVSHLKRLTLEVEVFLMTG